MKKWLLHVLRIVISVGLLVYLIYLADIRQIILAMQNLTLTSILLSILCFLGTTFFLSLRWQLLTQSYGLKVNYLQLVIFYFIGFFFNNFLPTSIGGDLGRAYYLAQNCGNRSASIGTVFLERIIGLLATLTLASVSLLWLVNYFQTKRIIYITFCLIITVALFLAVIMSRRMYKRFNGLLSLITFYDIGDKLQKVFDILHSYRNKKLILLGAFILSLSSQCMLIVMNFVLTRALGITEITFGYLFLVVPVTFIIGLLPSINGLGVRDTGYMILLTRQGVIPSKILSLSFSVIMIPMIMSIIGGIFFLFYRYKGVKTPELIEENLYEG